MYMNKIIKKQYVAPNLKVVSFIVEAGYSGSNSSSSPVDLANPILLNNSSETNSNSTWRTFGSTDGWFN